MVPAGNKSKRFSLVNYTTKRFHYQLSEGIHLFSSVAHFVNNINFS